ncbi:TAF5-like protein [Thozetella sp. PMI_491]|nr:TAF5-like protein [Thozetella sp. PMI_491]
MSSGVPPSAGAGPPTGSYGQPPPSAGGAPAGGAPPAQGQAQPPSAQNLNQIVTDYLKKKGFTKTEAIFRQETSNLGPDGRPIHNDTDDGPKKYAKAFNLLREYVDNSLDLYKFELRKLLWPVFVYSFLQLVKDNHSDEAKKFFNNFKSLFESVHKDDIATFATISLPSHLAENQTAQLYLNNSYRIPLNQYIEAQIWNHLETHSEDGGETITTILNDRCKVDRVVRGPIEPFSFEAILRRAQNSELDEADAQEGIPGHFTGLLNKDLLDTSTPLKLGPLPMETELRDDVRAELEDEDQRHPPAAGRTLLVEEFDRRIKLEESDDVPNRADLPLPPSRARDVVMEMQKVRENRDRFRIEGRTGGIGVGITACMFTFHNTLGSYSCMEFSNDHQLVAVGTMDSYIRVWSIDGKPLQSKMPNEQDLKVNNRKLIGHSAPVYGLSFSDSIGNLDHNLYGDKDKVDTGSKLLLSCSADGQVRLWSLDAWACLCIYKAHDGPVLRVLWGPHGHYFATAGWDKTVRVFMQDHASAQRIMVGHDTSISAIAWHPNGTYIFSASDETDKSIRMWSVTTGSCVRVFAGHTEYISSLQCAPSGKILASADAGGNIFFWDIDKGTRIKRCRGHGKGGIPSMSFSAESNVLVSGGLDGTIRVWDVELPTDPAKANPLAATSVQAAPQPESGAVPGDSIAVGGPSDGRSITVGGQAAPAVAGSTAAPSVGTGMGGTGGGKKKGKEVQVTPDQISAFPTKKTPVMKVQFTRMNLVVAGGCYDPER